MRELHKILRFHDAGEWPHEYGVDEAKDGGVGPDAQREREHGHGGEAGVLQQLAEGEFQIVHSWKGKHRTLNIEHRTSKVEPVWCLRRRCSAFDVGCSMFVLFITQRLHRIDPGCPAGRNVARNERGEYDQKESAEEN